MIISNQNKKWLKQLIIIPCLCHKVNCSFKNAVKGDKNLANIINIIHNISEECLANSNVLGAVCPTHINTRWIYDYEIVEFIIKHKEIISRFMEIPEEIFNLRDCLKILKTLIKIFENPSTPIGSAYIILEHAISAFKELDSLQNPYASIVGHTLAKHTINGRDLEGILMTSYIMTPNGHADFYQRLINNGIADNNNSYLKEFGIGKEEPLDPKVFEEPEEPINCIEKEAVDIILLNDKKNEEQEEEEDTFDIEQDELKIRDNVMNLEYSIDYRKGLLTPAFNFIKEWSQRFMKDEFKRKMFYSLFNTFASSSDDALQISMLNEKHYNWINLRTAPNLKYIGDLGLRFDSLGCSEAACERIISAQRMILNSRRVKSKKELIDCRLKLMRSDVIE